MCRNNKSKLKQSRGAFTLVELLVVIGIIALLISILLPALNKARNAARTTKCLANIHGLSQALLLYSVDYKGWLPAGRGNYASTNDTPWTFAATSPNEYQEYTWTWTMAQGKYVKNIQSFLCPKAFVRTRIAPGTSATAAYQASNFEGYLPNWDLTKRPSDGDNESNRSCYALRWGNFDPAGKQVETGLADYKRAEWFYNKMSDLRPGSEMFLITEVITATPNARYDYSNADATHAVFLRHGSNQQPAANTGYADGSARPTSKDYFEAKSTKASPLNYSAKIWPFGYRDTGIPVTVTKVNY